MSPATVRYIINDVDQALVFYCGLLHFDELAHPAPGFAMLGHGDLRLALNAVGGPGGASQAMPDGRVPVPGGWNRIQLEVADIEALLTELRDADASFRNDIVTG
jgi:hypothetical protein